MGDAFSDEHVGKHFVPCRCLNTNAVSDQQPLRQRVFERLVKYLLRIHIVLVRLPIDDEGDAQGWGCSCVFGWFIYLV